ncbi:unnamed protein product [Amoebophrya sp. A120]|nr:unnamed protein product [Amoebophrya sp. A120]|eukprot:GSA120T00017984001.1
MKLGTTFQVVARFEKKLVRHLRVLEPTPGHAKYLPHRHPRPGPPPRKGDPWPLGLRAGDVYYMMIMTEPRGNSAWQN